MTAAHRYVLHGVSIASDFVLTDLRADAATREAQVRIRIGVVPAPPAQAVEVRGSYMHWDGTRVLLSTPGTARFSITDQEICVEPDAAADADSVQMLLLGSVWGACCHLRGCLLLHASAAVVGTACVAFLGHSGAGKSTLAALLAARGHLVAADDTCVLVGAAGATHLHSGPRQMKLWRESLPLLADKATEIRPAAHQPGKFKLSLPTQWLDRPQPVQRLLLLDADVGGSPAGFTRLSTLESLQALAAHTFRPKMLALLGRQQQNFALCAAVTANTEVHRWIRPWGMDRRRQMVEMLEQWLDARTPANLPLNTPDLGPRSLAS
jgi:Mrp family chromosome partitioning ATPase